MIATLRHPTEAAKRGAEGTQEFLAEMATCSPLGDEELDGFLANPQSIPGEFFAAGRVFFAKDIRHDPKQGPVIRYLQLRSGFRSFASGFPEYVPPAWVSGTFPLENGWYSNRCVGPLSGCFHAAMAVAVEG